MNDDTEVTVPKGIRRQIQTFACSQKISEDEASEWLIRGGLEKYFAKQADKADAPAAVTPLPASPSNESDFETSGSV